MKCNTCHKDSCVRQVPVFVALPDQELHKVESIIESEFYGKGNVVFREGEQSDSLFVVNNGLIKLTQTSIEGKQHILRFLFPGDYFGQFALLHNKQHYATAEVVESGYICRMRREDFMPLIASNAGLAFSFLKSVSEQLQQADELAGALHIFEAEKRLARLLLHLYAKQSLSTGGGEGQPMLHLPAAKKEFAAMIGTTPETLSRKLNQLERMKLIQVNNRSVTILDLLALSQIAEITS
ncbi:hypothetical protein R70723_29630 [Paenibacillus sp. FSL R7-0273]|uniref:Crp/Fnr family transcriptional regulator n=1 Tax=Paenibacillus sp. FSL R7-0273 TaxID=1536772 RepID=UPI0004F6D52A|nr:Crp/Fnr family transcriptional regulator [Paenibacillus sp. FSL R7-0273]AIQ49572.1 hypothetical protein R70723_29630 [Paenibacillus sp. FSL R7-0273]OMF85992.1 hypothetical protein BK144_26910 [Paenibacillus sp. FSL R7-0273]